MTSMTTKDHHALDLTSAMLRTLRDELVAGRRIDHKTAAALEAGAMALDSLMVKDSVFLKGQATKKAREATAR